MEDHFYYSQQQPTIHSIPFQHPHDLYDNNVTSHATCEQNSNCCQSSSNYTPQQQHQQQTDDSIDEYLSNSDDDQIDDIQSSNELSATPPQRSIVCNSPPPTSTTTAYQYQQQPQSQLHHQTHQIHQQQHHIPYIVIQPSSSSSSSPIHTPHSPHYMHSPHHQQQHHHLTSPPQAVVHPYGAPAYYLHTANVSTYTNGNAASDIEISPRLPNTPTTHYSYGAATPTLTQYHLYPSALIQQQQQHHFHQVVYPSSPLDYQTAAVANVTPTTLANNSSPPSTPSTPSTPCHFLNNNEPSSLDNPPVSSPPTTSTSTSTTTINNSDKTTTTTNKTTNKSKKRSRAPEKPVVPSTPITIDSKIQEEINSFFTNYNNNVTLNNKENSPTSPVSIPLLISMSETQKNLYRDLLKNNIPKISHNQNENEKISFLHGLYLMLMKCANHPYQFGGVEPPKNTATANSNDDHLILCSGKLMVLDKLLEAMSQSSSAKPTRLFILSSSQPMLKILEDYFNLKYPGTNNDLEDENNQTQIILSTFLESSIYSPFKHDDLVVEFDHYWQSESTENTELSDSSLPSCGSANDHRSICPSFVLLAVDSVEEWAYQQFKNKSTLSSSSSSQSNTVISKKDNMIEMMKFCIVKMSAAAAAATNSSSSSTSNAKAPSTPVTATTTTAVASPVPSTPPASELNTPILTSPSTSSSSLSSSIGDAPGILSLYSQIHKDNNQDLWKTNSKTNTPFNFTFVSSEHNVVDPKTEFQTDKKRRNPKRQKNLCDRSCFLCKKEEDPKGRTSIVQCRSCPKIYHRSCAGLAHTPRSWKCPRHSCHSCRKTPNESGGSFFICKECPSSYCITCLPNDITILQKHEYSESKHDNEMPIQDSNAGDEVVPTTTTNNNNNNNNSNSNNKKPKTPRPTVYIQCGKCTRKIAASNNNNIALNSSTSSPSLINKHNTAAKISVCDSSNSSPELINSPNQQKDPDTPSLYLSDPESISPR
ncbi:hypothetical protein PPL_04447 [Heterostelium album PN500]|uniref:PHD-type domain-containing protein n=1 Tax=Heterostelium pallidum (strain ATCC 26659 / Pp 5 / PN500) TaxID=670386 RepID=D3B7K9_HETP5|nr:hypothetical protein PPL_04447 [Heterostelium album PN500]EFA82752.1 hypothetical protein PPL_04447 [Heterostelium album PN500]|eukprot:XP_020434869.1 hypothetical protein PPL_04447 [Heterostelium album PN500]